MGDITPKSYTQILTKGTQSELNATAITDGLLRYTTDTGCLFLDIKNDTESKRLKISDIDNSKTEEQILNIVAPLPKVYVSTDTHRAFVSAGISGMVDLAAIDLSVADVVDIDSPVWFTDPKEETTDPKYTDDLAYNTSSKKFKAPTLAASTSVEVNGMKITSTLNSDNTTHTVEFSFV